MNIKVRVKSGMKKESLRVASKSLFDVSVREEPKQNRANARVITLIARHFRVPIKQVRIVSGHHHPFKMVTVAD